MRKFGLSHIHRNLRFLIRFSVNEEAGKENTKYQNIILVYSTNFFFPFSDYQKKIESKIQIASENKI